MTTILPLVGDQAFRPEDIKILSNAMNVTLGRLVALRSSDIAPQNFAHSRELIARAIIELAKTGERDTTRLSQGAIAHLQEARNIARNDSL